MLVCHEQKKEGHKVNTYYTAKICLLGPSTFYGDHPNHNFWTFDYLHQGSEIFHFKCDLKTVVFHCKNLANLSQFHQIDSTNRRAYFTSKSSPKINQLVHLIWQIVILVLCESIGV